MQSEVHKKYASQARISHFKNTLCHKGVVSFLAYKQCNRLVNDRKYTRRIKQSNFSFSFLSVFKHTDTYYVSIEASTTPAF